VYRKRGRRAPAPCPRPEKRQHKWLNPPLSYRRHYFGAGVQRHAPLRLIEPRQLAAQVSPRWKRCTCGCGRRARFAQFLDDFRRRGRGFPIRGRLCPRPRASSGTASVFSFPKRYGGRRFSLSATGIPYRLRPPSYIPTLTSAFPHQSLQYSVATRRQFHLPRRASISCLTVHRGCPSRGPPP